MAENVFARTAPEIRLRAETGKTRLEADLINHQDTKVLAHGHCFIFALLLCGGCGTAVIDRTLQSPPQVPASALALASQPAAVLAGMWAWPVVTNVIAADFPVQPDGIAVTAGFFEASADLTNWQTISAWPYEAGTFMATNVWQGEKMFYRAGIE